MTDTLRDYFERRGGIGVLVALKSQPQRFTDLSETLHISTSTLTKRLGEARDLGFITPEIDEDETSVSDQYRITSRGQFVLRKMEQLEMVHAYRTKIDMQDKIEAGRGELIEWLADEDVRIELGKHEETNPYVDRFGEDITGFSE